MKLRWLAFLSLIIIAGCGKQTRNTTSNSHFSITQKDTEYTVTIKQLDHPETFVFSYTGRQGTIKIPVTRIAVLSGTHIGFLSALGEEKLVIAASDKKYIYNPELRKNASHIAELGTYPDINLELLIKLKPQILFTDRFDAFPPEQTKILKKHGITVIPVLDYTETDPVKRLEWIKIFGIATDKYAQATKYYDSVSNRYHSLTRNLKIYLDSSSRTKPKILVNIPFRGIWYVPGGKTYIARFISDAGGNYPWKNTESNKSLPLNFEQVYRQAGDADILINTGLATSINDILLTDKRLENFKAVKNGMVYNNNKLRNKYGGTAFWENGTVQPDRILADLIRIFYPDNNFTPDTLTFYIKLK